MGSPYFSNTRGTRRSRITFFADQVVIFKEGRTPAVAGS
jgi:hypothetical protein